MSVAGAHDSPALRSGNVKPGQLARTLRTFGCPLGLDRGSPMSTTACASSTSGSRTSNIPSCTSPNWRVIVPSGECTSTELSWVGLMRRWATERLAELRNSIQNPLCLPACGVSPICGGVIICNRSWETSATFPLETRKVSRNVFRDGVGGWLTVIASVCILSSLGPRESAGAGACASPSNAQIHARIGRTDRITAATYTSKTAL